MDLPTRFTDEPEFQSAGIIDGAVSTSKLADAAVTTAKIADDAVTFAKLQNIATGRLLGRSSSGSGDIEEITIGSGLTLADGALSASTTNQPQLRILNYTSSGTWTKADHSTIGSGTRVLITVRGGGGAGASIIALS